MALETISLVVRLFELLLDLTFNNGRSFSSIIFPKRFLILCFQVVFRELRNILSITWPSEVLSSFILRLVNVSFKLLLQSSFRTILATSTFLLLVNRATIPLVLALFIPSSLTFSSICFLREENVSIISLGKPLI